MGELLQQKQITTAFDRSRRERERESELLQLLNWNSQLLNIRIYATLFCLSSLRIWGHPFPASSSLKPASLKTFTWSRALGVSDSFAVLQVCECLQSQKLHPITPRSPNVFLERRTFLCFWKCPSLGQNQLITAHLQILNARHRRGYGVPMGCQSNKQNPWEPAAWIASCCSPASHETVSMDWHVIAIIHNV